MKEKSVEKEEHGDIVTPYSTVDDDTAKTRIEIDENSTVEDAAWAESSKKSAAAMYKQYAMDAEAHI